MPKYKVPAEKVSMPCDPGGTSLEKKHQPSIYIPASEEIMKVFEIGQKAEIHLVGKVTGMHADENRKEMVVEVDTVTAYPEDNNEYTALSEDEDE